MHGSVRFYLRDTLQPAHDRIDGLYGTLDLRTVGGLGTFLSSHFLAVRAVEGALARRALPASIRRPGSLLGALSSDLATLGLSRPDDPEASDFPAAGDGTGLLYVHAGSRLGTRFLARDWAQTGCERVRAAGNYMTSPALADSWEDVCAYLETLDPASDRVSSLKEEAAAAYRAFEHSYFISAQ